MVKIKDYVSRAEELKFGVISITDHNNTESHQTIEKIQEETEVLLIPGQEVSTTEGHLLVYGWVPQVPKNYTMKESVEFVRDESKEVLCIAAHPFDRFRSGHGLRIFESGIDGVEILNASTWLNYFNTLSNNASKGIFQYRLANSDAHRLSEFGTAWNEIKEAESMTEVFQNLKAGEINGGIIGVKRKLYRFLRRKVI